MRLVLKTIRWKNFLSTGNIWTEIDLSSHKTTLIVGKNGSGKSTLLDAISFLLFGKPFRKINKPQLVNTITNSDCVVEGEFTINDCEFKVVRGIKPNIFEIIKDGETITQTADNRDYQEAFETYILKSNHKTFCQIVILGSAIFTPFMALAAAQRREIIEDLLNLEVFTKMNVLLKDKLLHCDYDLQEKQSHRNILEERYKLTKNHFDQMSESKEHLIEDAEEKVKNITNQIEEIVSFVNDVSNQIAELEGSIEPMADIFDKQTELRDINTQLKQKSRILNKDILFFTNNEVCPTCHQNIDSEFKAKIIEERKTASIEVESALTMLDKKFETLSVKLVEIGSAQEKKRRFNESKLEKTTLQNSLLAQKTDIEREIEKMRTETFDFDFSKLNDMQKELADIEQIIMNCNDDRTVMGYAAVLLKDSGIKAKIIKTFIPVINQLIQKYLAELDFFVEFNLDETFSETILSRHRDNFSYESFSEGEKMRLNLAILFAWRAIARLRSSINVNVLIFDELLDSSLDNEGIDDIIRLIGNLTENDNVIIISHREDQISDKFDKIIRFEKIKSFSSTDQQQ